MTLRVRLRHAYPGFTLDAAFEAPTGVTVLFGRSGSGKSTIAQAAAGLLRPDEGHVALDGAVLTDTAARVHVPPRRRRVGYVFQDARLFPHMTVAANLDYGRRLAPRAERGDTARIVRLLGLEALLGRRPGALSGGETQRVAIGRALLCAPRLLIADEPLAALDEARKAEILPYLERLAGEAIVPILYVSHAPAEVARLATTVVALEGGRVIRTGPAAEVLADPAITPAGARGAGAVLVATVSRHHADGLTELEAGGLPLLVPLIGSAPGARVRVRIAASEVILARARPEGLSALNVLPGTVAAVRAGEGPGAIVSVATAAGTVLARVTRRSVAALGLAPGATCFAIVKSVAIAPGDVGGGGGGGGGD